jgi:hypothetical protein
MNAKVEWLERSLLTGPYLTLCLTPKQFVRAMKDMKLTERPEDWLRNDHCGATVHLRTRGGQLVCIVCLRPPGKNISIEQVAGLLAHEATHIWQYFRRRIGEDAPSDEFEAYSIQVITQRLFESYRTQTKRTRRRK